MKKIVKKTKEINEGGRLFLLFGECVSFEKIIMAEAKDRPYMYKINDNSVQQPIYFDYGNDDNKNS